MPDRHQMVTIDLSAGHDNPNALHRMGVVIARYMKSRMENPVATREMYDRALREMVIARNDIEEKTGVRFDIAETPES